MPSDGERDRFAKSLESLSNEAFAEAMREFDAEPGLACVCGATWCRVEPLRRLADVDCPRCGAGYADVGRNVEP